MLIIRTSGNAYDRGVAQGGACAALAMPWFERTLAEAREKVPAGDIGREASRLTARLERAYPDGYMECRGIASGMGMPEDDYFAAVFSARLLSKLVACTTFGFRGGNGEPLFCKTDDLGLEDSPLNVMEITSPSDGYRHVHFHFAGTVWTIAGMNQRGLAMGMTGIPGPMPDEDGLFSLDALHTILPHCADVAEVEAHLEQLQVSCYGFSLMAADASGGLALFEKSRAGLVKLPEQSGGFYLHTNHILDPTLALASPEQYEPVKSNGERRFANALQIEQSLSRSADGLARFVSDRSAVGPICQRGEDGLYSSLRLIFEPFRLRMLVWPGHGDDIERQAVEVDTLWGQNR